MPILSPDHSFESLKARVAEALRAQFPFEGSKRRLELVDVSFDEHSASPEDAHHIDNIDAQFKARTEGGTWGVPIRGHLRLVDKATGHVIQEKTSTLARLPKLTRRYSFIINGQELQHDSVFRSKPRPYHRIAANGQIQGRWNLARGRGFDINYEPRNGHLSMRVGSMNIPLYPILHVLGVSDPSMESAWGSVVFAANSRGAKLDRDIDKLFKALNLRLADHGASGSLEQKAARVRTYFADETEVWPDAMKSAFGKPFTHVDGEGLLLSSKRLIDIQKGRSKEDPRTHELPDDRQALSSKYLATTEDFLVEAVRHAEGDLRKKVADRIDKTELDIDDILSPNTYNKVLLGKFENAQRPDQTNPLQFLSGYMRTTIRGKDFGGVGSEKINLDPDKRINPTHLGFLDPVQTPESEDTGIALHLPLGIAVERAAPIPGSRSKVSSGQDIKTKVYDTKIGQMVLATPADLEHAIVAYPDQVRWFGGKPTPVATDVVCYDEERKTSKRPWSKVRYVLPSAKALFSFSANLIPFLQNNSGNRAMTAAKQQEQAVSLAHREEPLVQVKTDKAQTFEQVMGQFAAHFTPVGGRVTHVEPGAVTIDPGGREKPVRVPVYNYYPLNGGRNALHAETTVRVGQTVRKGDLIADTNFTKNGTLAMGSNLRVAYVPWKGLNFEDGIVVSESAAKKMASSHMHQLQITVYPGMVGGSPGDRAKWVDHSTPERTVADRMNKLDDRGVVKEGVTVHEGDVLVAALSPAVPTAEDEIVKRIHKGLVQPFRDSSLVWDHEYVGKVVKVIVTEGLNRKTITVHVATEEPLVVGDKMTGRHGNKGIVSRIIPDHMMPKTKDGVHADVLLNPAGVPSRMNVGQVLETAASKIAERTGKPYIVENFLPGVDYSEKVKRDLKAHGVTDTEELFDPETGRSIGPILTGKQYMFKLHHMVEKKMTGRSFGQGYTSSGDAPSGSGIPGGGQKMDMLTTYAMLAHGARNNLREAYTFKSDGTERSDGRSADAVWAAVMTGRPLPPPESNRGMKNFIDYMRALGINTEKKGDEYTIMPATDAHLLGDPKRGIIGISNGEIKLPDRVVAARGNKTLEEMGGLFDPKVTGGMKGRFWSHVRLPERMPNPLFESAIQVLTGTTKKQYDTLVGPDLLQGGKSGFHIIVDKLRSIDVDKELEKEKARLPSLSRSDLSTAVKRIRYLEALKQHNMTPLEAYTNEHLPVLPPIVRRVTPGLDGKQMVDDRNFLYAAVGQAVSELRDADPAKPKTDVQKMRSHLYETIRALKITGTTQTAGKPRHLAGLMEMLSGKTDGSGAPKNSFFQNGVLSRRQDLSGRSTIVPEPALHLDEVGIPVPIAMEMYRPFVARELHREGVEPTAANRMTLKNRDDPRVLSALERAVENRPVMLKRDPALHQFSIMAFRPKLVEGKAIKIHPLVTGGFNADFDGDTMALYVPVSEEAVDEARKMMPSRNLFSPTHFGLMTLPGQDSLLGIYQATKWGKEAQAPQGLSREKAVEMMEHGKLKPSDVVVVDGKKTTPGRLALAQHLPSEMQHDERLLHDPNYLLDKGNLQALLTRVGKEHEQAFPHVVDEWKDLGNKLSYLNGSSFSIDDFHDGKHFRDDVLERYRMREAQLHATPMTSHKKDKELVKLWTEARKELEERGKARYNMRGDNRVWEWAQAKARGNWEQFSQLVYGPMLVQDASKKDVPVPITKSYGEGLSVSEYWASMHGARKGTLDRVQGTREPGAVTKDIINTVMGMHVSAEDCGATDGVKLSPQDPDAIDRYLARAVKVGGDVMEAGQLLTPALATKLMNAGVQQVVLRSPLYCRMGTGICQKSLIPETMVVVCPGREQWPVHVSLEDLFDMVPRRAVVAEDGTTQKLLTEEMGWLIQDADGWAPLLRVLHHPREAHKKLYELKTATGRTLHLTEDHTMVVRRRTTICPSCDGTSLSRDARSFASVHLHCRECGHNFTVTAEEWEQTQALEVEAQYLLPGDLIEWRCVPERSGMTTPPIDPYFLGAYLAEGSVAWDTQYPREVQIAQARESVARGSMLAAAARVTKNRVSETDSKIVIADTKLVRTIRAVVGEGRAESKWLGSSWMEWPSQYVAQVFSGIFDGDGSVRTREGGYVEASIGSTSYRLLVQLQEWLQSLGVRAALSCNTQAPSGVVKTRKDMFHLTFVPTGDLLRMCSSVKLAGVILPEYQRNLREVPGVEVLRKLRDVSDKIHAERVFDVTTGSGTFIANGLHTHNCYGKNERGHHHALGTNIGILAGHALGEPITQLTMKTFHTGGASGSGASAVDSFMRVKQLFDLPEKLPDAATLAEVSGTVEKIVHEPAIGYIITIGGKEHRVVTGHPLDHIKVGNAVHRGDPISTGPINPHDLLAQTKSIGRVRDYMTNELMKKELYGGLGVRRRNVETVIKGMTNLSEVVDAPPHSPFMRGEHVPLSEIEAHNAEAEAEGRETVKHSPKLKPMEQAPLAGVEDWLARLNYQRLKETYTEGAAQGWRSNIKKHPIPGLAHGAEFGLHPFEPTKPPPVRRTPGTSS